MSSPATVAVHDNKSMTEPGSRSGGPSARRSFTPEQELNFLDRSETAIEINQGGAYLLGHGLYSSQVTEWRKLRDGGALAGKQPGHKVGRLSPEQAEVAKLRRELEITRRRLGITEVALGIMGKAHELLEEISKSSHDDTPQPKR